MNLNMNNKHKGRWLTAETVAPAMNHVTNVKTVKIKYIFQDGSRQDSWIEGILMILTLTNQARTETNN